MKGHRIMAALQWEVENLNRFLGQFEATPGRRRSARLHDTGEFVVVQNVPLPDRYRPDAIDVLLITDQFPSTPPIGLYALNKSASVVKQLEGRFNAFPNAAFHGAAAIPDYTWICYHYQGNRWAYNTADPRRGDNIAKFLGAFYAEA